MGQQVLGNSPACVDFANHLTLLNPHIIQKTFAEWRVTGDQLDGFGADARRSHVKQHQSDAQLLLGIRIGTHQTEHPVSLVGIGGPDFLAVDDEMIALVHCTSLQAGQVRTRTRLAVALTPANFATHNRRQMLAFKLFRAKFENRRTNHPHTKAGQRGPCTDARQLLTQHLVLLLREATTAVLRWPVRRGPALSGHTVKPELLVVTFKREVATTPALVTFLSDGLTHAWRAVFIQPCASLLTEGIKIGHRYSPCYWIGNRTQQATKILRAAMRVGRLWSAE